MLAKLTPDRVTFLSLKLMAFFLFAFLSIYLDDQFEATSTRLVE
jgi:hypothetical protein